MARVIDGDAVKRRTWDIAEAWKDQGRNYEALLLESVIEQIVDTQTTLTPPNEWLSVEERLPKYNIREDGELVSSKILCYCETDKTVHLAVSQKFYIGRMGEVVHPIFRYYDEWGDEIEDVSHWMHLPAPPTKEE